MDGRNHNEDVKILECFIEPKEKAPGSISSESIVQTEVCSCAFIEKHPQSATTTRLPMLEQSGAEPIVGRLNIEKSDATQEFVPGNGKAIFQL